MRAGTPGADIRPNRFVLAPATDPKAFVDRIHFGGSGRGSKAAPLYIRVDDDKTKTATMLARTVRFVEELPDKLRGNWFAAPVKAIALWTGRSEEGAFWSVLRSDVGDPNKAAMRELERRER